VPPVRGGRLHSVKTRLFWDAQAAACSIILCFGLVPSLHCQDSNALDTLTLDEAVTLAVHNNRTLQIAALEVEKSKQDAAAFRTKRLPNVSTNLVVGELLTDVDFRFQEGQFGTFPGTGPIPSKNISIETGKRPFAFTVAQVAQPISQQYKIGLGLRLKQLTTDIESEKLRGQRQAIVSQTKKVYYELVQTEAALHASQESLRYYHELDRVTDSYVFEKTALQSDSLEVKARVAQEEYTALKLTNSLSTTKEQLNLLLGRDVRTDFAVQTMPAAAEFEQDLPAAQALALANRPELRQAQVTAQQAEYDRRLAKADYIPDVNLLFYYASPFGTDLLPHNIASLGVQIQWEPLDWGRRKHEIEQKNLSMQQSQHALTETQSKIVIDVNDHFRRLSEARALVAVTNLNREAAGERLRVITDRYSEKASLLRDVLESQAAYSQAGSAYQQALASFWSAKTELERALGEDR
jgi:outer membrane protein